MRENYDLIVLGAGSGGVAASRRAAAHGARVAIVEGGRVGGTCVIRGCVPKKLLMYAAQFGDAFAQARGYGWSAGDASFAMADWQAAKAAETQRLEAIYRQMLVDAQVELVSGWGALHGPRQVRVGDRVLQAPHILIATGAAAQRDTLPGIEVCATSDDLLDLDRLPTSLAVIGGGYIAVEFASMLARLGVAVSQFYRADLPLRGFDAMLRSGAADALSAAGVRLQPGQSPAAVERADKGYVLVLADGTRQSFPWVLNATGRSPNTARLGLASVGLEVDTRGAVPVDERWQTPVSGVYAVGDVSNRKNLTPVAIAEGRAWADGKFGASSHRQDLGRVTSAVFMLPPVASCGPSEEEALAAEHSLKVFESNFRPMKQALGGGSERTRIKLLADAETDRVLAVHMLGSDAPEIVQCLAVALSAGATKAHFDQTIAVHPTTAEEFVLLREPTRCVAPETLKGSRVS